MKKMTVSWALFALALTLAQAQEKMLAAEKPGDMMDRLPEGTTKKSKKKGDKRGNDGMGAKRGTDENKPDKM